MLHLLLLLLLATQTINQQEVRAPAAPAAPQAGQPPSDPTAELRRQGVEVEFTGNEAFTGEELLALAARGRGSALRYLAEGATDAEKLDYSLRLLRNELAAQGYLRAKLGPSVIEQTASGHKLTIPVREGRRYRFGRIKIEGVTVFTPEQLQEMIAVKEGEVASGETIYTAFYERLKRAYEDRGYIQYSAEPEPTFHRPPAGAKDGVVDFLVTVDEGRRFTVAAIEFQGGEQVPDWVLRPALRLRVGQPFSRTLFEESVQQLNALDLFERIDPDGDVDFRAGHESARVKLIIKLRPKVQP